MRPVRQSVAVALGMVPALVLFGGIAHAEFNLNWERDNPTGAPGPGCPNLPGLAECSRITHEEGGEGGLSPIGQSRFVYEMVQDETGANYYHMIVGTPEDGFAQELYIEVSAGSPFQGVAPISGRTSSSGGAGAASVGTEGAGFAPLDSDRQFTGNATGNPNRVQMRQLMTDGELTVDFVKNVFLEKPTITSTINGADMVSTFIIDGSGNPLNQANPSPVTNTVELLDPAVPEGSANFDMATDAQNSRVTAGEYTTANPVAGAQGAPYVYADPNEDVNLNPSWADFFDHREDNPWAYEENRPVAGP